jgi:TonB-dependent starch-binding outer membrane protein SusC
MGLLIYLRHSSLLFFISLLFLSHITLSQDFTVRGQVSDENGESLPGVNVVAKSTTIGTVTDIEGTYSLSVPENTSTLVFTSVGYQSTEVTIGSRNVINVSMTPDIQSLSEVVVIGYGTQERADLTGSVSSVSSEEITQVPNVNIANTIQGRAPGVVVTENSGRPGAEATILIRGAGTVGNSSPLFVVDGQILTGQTGLQSLNPNDIESIEILKDASASAIYGARAANGVVLITTKRGEAGKTKLSYNGFYGPQWINDRSEWMNASEWVQNQIDVAEAQGNASVWNDEPSDPDPASFGEGINYWDKLWQTGILTDHNINMSGGNENSQFVVSLGYLSNEGVMVGQDFERYTVRINTDHRLTDWLTVGQNLQLSRSNEIAIGGTGAFNNMFQGAMTMSPTVVPERLPDGQWNGATRPGESNDFSTFSPNHYLEERENETNQWLGLGNVYTELKLAEGLKFRTTFNGLFRYSNNFLWDGQLVTVGHSSGPTALSRNTNVTTNWQLDNILTYDKTFGKHTISALAGYTAQENIFEFLNASVTGFLIESLQVINAGNLETLNGSGSKNDWSLNSIISRINYEFDNKYLFQANFRADGSSRFGPGNRWGYFPSFSAGWRISEESFFDVAAISNLKLRGSWGQLGNDRIGLYAFTPSISLSQRYTLGADQSILPGAAPLSLANEDIKWEQTTQWDIGVDMGFFENKLNITADYFNKTTNDILVQIPLPVSAGYTTSPFVNAGIVENRGWEFMATYRNYDNAFSWDASVNLSSIQNEVISLGEREEPIFGGLSDVISDVGTEVNAFYGYVSDGLYQNQAEIDAVNELNPDRDYDPGAGPGAVRFVDIDGDGVITPSDRSVIGSPYPDLNIGLNFTARYKGFDFALFFQGAVGQELLLANNDNWQLEPGLKNQARFNLDRWFEEGDTNDAMLWGVNGLNNASGGRNGRTPDFQVLPGDYIRAKNIQLGYTLPNSITENIGISRLRIYASTKNLITFWNQDPYNLILDPELGNEGSGFGKFNFSTTPQPKTIIFGVNLDF